MPSASRTLSALYTLQQPPHGEENSLFVSCIDEARAAALQCSQKKTTTTQRQRRATDATAATVNRRRRVVSAADIMLHNADQALTGLYQSAGSGAVSEGLAHPWVDRAVRETYKDLRINRLLSALNRHASGSEKLAHDEVLDILLDEAQRIQAENGITLQQRRRAPPQPESAPPRQQHQTRPVAHKDNARAQELVKEMYSRISRGGAVDGEGMLDMLLQEADGLRTRRRDLWQQAAIRAKL
ncbi:hypothetical protein HDU86_001225 [Geranomyces michiganensis]|nr:hypothetical protein HDU86_001225 [Geranomyces michiganensis]